MNELMTTTMDDMPVVSLSPSVFHSSRLYREREKKSAELFTNHSIAAVRRLAKLTGQHRTRAMATHVEHTL